MKEQQLIANNIQDIILLIENYNLQIPEDKNILETFEELTVMVINNFAIPEKNEEYILKHLNLQCTATPEIMIREFKENIKKTKNFYNIGLPLRAVSVYFQYGKPEDIEFTVLIKLKYLIAKLHLLCGDKTMNSILKKHKLSVINKNSSSIR